MADVVRNCRLFQLCFPQRPPRGNFVNSLKCLLGKRPHETHVGMVCCLVSTYAHKEILLYAARPIASTPCTLGTREYLLIVMSVPCCTLWTREGSAISASGTLGSREGSAPASGTSGIHEDPVIQISTTRTRTRTKYCLLLLYVYLGQVAQSW